MSLKRIYWVLLLFVWASSSLAENTPGPTAKMSGDLGLVIVASDSPDYIKKWLTTPSSHAVTIKRLKVAKPNQLIVAAFLVTGMSGNSEGNYDFSISFYVLDPNQKTLEAFR